jgi:hypothetical protein
MKKCIWLAMSVSCWCLLSVTASAQVLQVPQQTVSPGGVGMGGQPLPGFIQNPGQFPQNFVPGGQGMGAQGLPSGMTPTVPFNQIMQMRMMQMMGSHRGVQYGPGGNNNMNNMNGYNNPNFMTPNTAQQDPEQMKRDERRSKVRERAESKRAKEREQAELRKAKGQDAKDNAAQAKVAEAKK